MFRLPPFLPIVSINRIVPSCLAYIPFSVQLLTAPNSTNVARVSPTGTCQSQRIPESWKRGGQGWWQRGRGGASEQCRWHSNRKKGGKASEGAKNPALSAAQGAGDDNHRSGAKVKATTKTTRSNRFDSHDERLVLVRLYLVWAAFRWTSSGRRDSDQTNDMGGVFRPPSTSKMGAQEQCE